MFNTFSLFSHFLLSSRFARGGARRVLKVYFYYIAAAAGLMSGPDSRDNAQSSERGATENGATRPDPGIRRNNDDSRS